MAQAYSKSQPTATTYVNLHKLPQES